MRHAFGVIVMFGMACARPPVQSVLAIEPAHLLDGFPLTLDSAPRGPDSTRYSGVDSSITYVYRLAPGGGATVVEAPLNRTGVPFGYRLIFSPVTNFDSLRGVYAGLFGGEGIERGTSVEWLDTVHLREFILTRADSIGSVQAYVGRFFDEGRGVVATDRRKLWQLCMDGNYALCTVQ